MVQCLEEKNGKSVEETLGMTKGSAVEELIRGGYKARLENGVVMVSAPMTEEKKIVKLLKTMGYKSSWGIRNETDNEANS